MKYYVEFRFSANSLIKFLVWLTDCSYFVTLAPQAEIIMFLKVNSNFELWSLWIESECRKAKLKYKLEEEVQIADCERDIILTNIDETIAIQLLSEFKDKRKSTKTLLEAVKVKHLQLSRPVDIQEAFSNVKLRQPSDSFSVATELKRLATYVDGNNEFLVQQFLNSVVDFEYKLLVQQLISSKERVPSIDELADFLSKMPAKPQPVVGSTPSTSMAVRSISKGNSQIWAARRCYNCQQLGHGAKWCKEPKKFCQLCRKYGHNDCNQKNA